MLHKWVPDRREILQALGLAVVVEALPLGAVALSQVTQDGVSCFIEESGIRGRWPLVLGALTTSEPVRHAAGIRALRKRHNYSRMLSYTSNDRQKLKFATSAIDYFSGDDGLHYVALVVTDSNMRWPKTTDRKDAIYFEVYGRLLDKIRSEANDPQKSKIFRGAASAVLLRMRQRTRRGRDRLLHAHLSNVAGFLPGANAAPKIVREFSGRQELTQLAAFLAGCIRSDIVGAGERKTALVTHLKSAIGVDGSLRDAAVRKMSVTTLNL
jgi:hypothetical protein